MEVLSERVIWMHAESWAVLEQVVSFEYPFEQPSALTLMRRLSG